MLIDSSHIPFLVAYKEDSVVMKPAQIGTVVFWRDWRAVFRNTPQDTYDTIGLNNLIKNIAALNDGTP